MGVLSYPLDIHRNIEVRKMGESSDNKVLYMAITDITDRSIK